MNRFIIILLAIIFGSGSLCGQEKLKFINKEQSQFQIPFEVSQNLIIVPVRINGSDIMKFILDSGISNTIITEMTGVDTVSLNVAREVKLEGLGEGESLTAWYSDSNNITMEDPIMSSGGIIGKEMSVYVIPEDRFGFSKQFGLQINGLIGADFFTHFIVEIDYNAKRLTFYDRENFNFKRKTKRHFQIPLEIENRRPYVKLWIHQGNGPKMKVKLLIDTGASMAMWLSVFSDERITMPENTFPALLGQGLNGNIDGVNGRIEGMEIGPFKIHKPIVSYPDSSGILGMMNEKGRNGTMGNEILKRFHVFMDYEEKIMYLKANKHLHEPFNYNRSGLEIEKPFYNLPIFHIYNVVPGSPADMAGVKIGDEIEMINYLAAMSLELDQINSILYGTEGRVVRLRIKRDGELITTKFTLDNKL